MLLKYLDNLCHKQNNYSKNIDASGLLSDQTLIMALVYHLDIAFRSWNNFEEEETVKSLIGSIFGRLDEGLQLI